ncbi:cob(I)yrinic acid a,c-diamide adenosyltransferase [Thermotoga sp. KOL6]|uniref:cob(I)yrinic acid a,c-diamide adenosyltransferase n=1 Tax=Thermotoga sp. KOL6 TaxID=126741 RepID=UPI000C7787EC|nr:cob(I)yrinic acid a,c-diamide adenosyltransferase [Thermotoga sp. KOL6]PLV60195.1 cob(I)yrinic acid a,c-diamide adenosyltransferase [Thermotoga sp. KOL6]
MRGYVQVYTGDGKGKTTAALGLSVRAACAGLKVFIGQFLKGSETSELKINEFFSNIEIVQYGTPDFVFGKPRKDQIERAKKGLDDAQKRISSGEYDIVVLDELCVAIHLGFFSREEIEALLNSKPEHVELVITGRYAPEWLMERADLVTEMREVKHYYKKGISARKGIEF